MSNYVERNLKEGEQIISEVKRSSLLLIGKIISCIFYSVVGVVGGLFVHPALYAIIPIAAIILVFNFISFHRSTLTLTNERLIFRTGLFTTRSADIPYEQVGKVEIVQTFWGKLFHFSRITVDTGELSCEALDGVVDGDKFKNIIVTQADEKRKALANEQAQANARAMREAMMGMNNPPQQ